MSNIFGAMRRGGASPAELEEAERESLQFEEKSHEPSPALVRTAPVVLPRTAASASVTAPAFRERELRISALAPLLPFESGHQVAAEQYQIIRTKILHHVRKPQVVLVSSASSGDGKSVTSINLAASLALKAEARVLLVDGDLRRPSIARTLGIPAVPGLADVLAGRAGFEEATVRARQVPNLYVLPAGESETRAADLLDSARWQELIAEARGRFTTIICDAPPVATVADFELLELLADGVILVARPEHTGRAPFRKALTGINTDKLLGVVLNCVEDWWAWKTPVYGYYGKASAAGQK